ncbi:MAG TPA: aminotransferase class IV [Paludibacter sp.]|nr:aminotransferase class IV [Paludibacter sp.]
MCLFVESIKLKDGQFYRLKLHQERINKAFAACYPDEEPVNIVETLYEYSLPQAGIYKCRVVYDSDVQSVEFTPYVQREIRSLKLVDTELESLAYKLEDRTGFNAAFALRSDCDDVLLIKNGLLTDTSYCNIALFDGENWYTPRIPLLYGVNRAQLISEGKLIEKDLKPAELVNFQYACLFNAMIEFGELNLKVSDIYQ